MNVSAPPTTGYTDPIGVELGSRWTAVEAAGLYVPGGTASYPSSVLMNAVPARVAGVERLVITVPTPDGVLNPLVLAAAHLCEIDEVYRVGGAQAIAALAYGTNTIAPVDKIVGPGNAYVATAKRQVFGTVGIDMIAGPSEVLVVADGANDPDWLAADLLAQAEHDIAAQSILITDDAALGARVTDAVARQLTTLPRGETAAASWRDFGAIIVVEHLDQAVPLVNRIAPEHLELAVEDPRTAAGQGASCGCGVPRTVHAGSDRRLCRRHQSCAADGALGTVFLRSVGHGFSETHIDPEMRCRHIAPACARGNRTCRMRGA